MQRANGSVVMPDENQQEVLLWKFKRGWPRNFKGPGYNASNKESAFETIEVCHKDLVIDARSWWKPIPPELLATGSAEHFLHRSELRQWTLAYAKREYPPDNFAPEKAIRHDKVSDVVFRRGTKGRYDLNW